MSFQLLYRWVTFSIWSASCGVLNLVTKELYLLLSTHCLAICLCFFSHGFHTVLPVYNLISCMWAMMHDFLSMISYLLGELAMVHDILFLISYFLWCMIVCLWGWYLTLYPPIATVQHLILVFDLLDIIFLFLLMHFYVRSIIYCFLHMLSVSLSIITMINFVLTLHTLKACGQSMVTVPIADSRVDNGVWSLPWHG